MTTKRFIDISLWTGVFSLLSMCEGLTQSCPPFPPVPPPNLPPGDPSSTGVANAQDPNEKRGPIGFGAANFLAPSAALPYRIKFENFGPGSVGANGAPLPSQVWASAPA